MTPEETITCNSSQPKAEKPMEKSDELNHSAVSVDNPLSKNQLRKWPVWPRTVMCHACHTDMEYTTHKGSFYIWRCGKCGTRTKTTPIGWQVIVTGMHRPQFQPYM